MNNQLKNKLLNQYFNLFIYKDLKAFLNKRFLRITSLLFVLGLLNACAVVSVASTAVSLGASAVGLAADAAVGTVRLTGKAVGAVADTVLPSSDKD